MVSDKYKLEFAAILIRHGDRGPLVIYDPNNTDHFCGIPVADQETYSSYVGNVSRYRLPKAYQNYARFPSGDNCKPSMLSKVGVMQHLKLGSFLNKKYREDLGFLTGHDKVEQLSTVVTNRIRTFQSALAFLHGFAPDILNQTAAISMMEVDPNLCFEKSLCECEWALHLDHLLGENAKDLIRSHPAITNLLLTISNVITGKFTSIRPVMGVDFLSLSVCHSKLYPCLGNSGKCLSSEHLQRLISYVEWERAKQVDNPNYHKSSRLKSQSFFIHLLEKVLGSVVPRSAKDAPHHKFILYSGHDVNIDMVLMALGQGLTCLPPYASRLAFEVYSDHINADEVSYFIRVLFNGKDITRYTLFCKELWQKSRPMDEPEEALWCPLDNFIDFVNNSHLRMMKAKSFEAACKLPPK